MRVYGGSCGKMYYYAKKKDRRCRTMSKEYGDSVRWAMYSLGCRVSYSSGVRVEKVSFIIE